MKTWTTGQMFGGIATAAVVAAAVCAGLMRAPAGSDITLPNSPLYNIAVTESVKGLEDKKEDTPKEEVCPDCGKIHAPAQGTQKVAQSAGGTSTKYSYCDNCKVYHPIAADKKVALDGLGGDPASEEP